MYGWLNRRMNSDQQKIISSDFEQMYRSGITPWKDHPPAPVLVRYFDLLKEKFPQGKLLDLGCGDGWISIIAAKRSFEVWGIDGSETAIERAKVAARTQIADDKVHFSVGNVLSLPYEAEFFEGMVDRGLFHHIIPVNRPVYFENILSVLKRGSLIYLAVFSMRNTEGIGQRFTKKEINGLFSPHFDILEFEEDPFPTPAPAHLLHFILRRN